LGKLTDLDNKLNIDEILERNDLNNSGKKTEISDNSEDSKKNDKEIADDSSKFIKKASNVRQNRVYPDSIPVNSTDLKIGMKIGGPVYRNHQIIIEVDTELDDRKINFLQQNIEVVYVVPTEEIVVNEEEIKFKRTLKNALNGNDFKKLLDLLKNHPQSMEHFTEIIENVKNNPPNEDSDSIFDTVLMYFDIGMRETALSALEVYDYERYLTELFKTFVEFEIENFNESKLLLNRFNELFKEKNKTFFTKLGDYYEVLEDDKKLFIHNMFKSIGIEKMKKMLYFYASSEEHKDLAYEILNDIKGAILDKKDGVKPPPKIDLTAKNENIISFTQILKEIELRKARKEKVISMISKVNIPDTGSDKIKITKKSNELHVGDILAEGLSDDGGKLIYPAETILSEDNINFINKNFYKKDFEIFSVDEFYNLFTVLTESLEDPGEKLELFIYFMKEKEGRTELETLGATINFPDTELRLEALKYLITNISPKRFIYIVEALKTDLKETPDILKQYFEAKNDIFSMKLFLKILADKQDPVLVKKTRIVFQSSPKLKEMLKSIIKNSSSEVKKLCLDLL